MTHIILNCVWWGEIVSTTRIDDLSLLHDDLEKVGFKYHIVLKNPEYEPLNALRIYLNENGIEFGPWTYCYVQNHHNLSFTREENMICARLIL